jgi:DNA-binding beta-propeller fold protein YncE
MRRNIGKVLCGALLFAAGVGSIGRVVEAQDVKYPVNVPSFQFDPTWPKMDSLKIGMLMGLAVDSHDHIWLLHRQSTIAAKDKAQQAPPVVELDADGNFVQGWGGPGEGYEWSKGHEHGIFVDYKDNVWIGSAEVGSNKEENQVLKFTKTGKFLMQIGHRGKSTGSNDPENLRGAADIYVDPKNNEAYVADGYGNHRVIVFDADTGAFKRLWGAYGSKPDDSNPGGPDYAAQFGIVHQAVVSKDGLVYVADHTGGRIQVFTPDGKFVKERELGRYTKPRAGTVSIVFSVDPRQQFLYVADLRRWVIDVLDRQTLQTVAQVGHQGDQPGEFMNPHNMASDSKGNLYVADMGTQADRTWAGRVQRFLLKP